MMTQRPSDERLIAYLDGELAEGERAEIAAWLERDAELRERAARLSESAALLRTAFDEVLHEPLPERLVAAARGETGAVVDLAAARGKRGVWRQRDRRWWISMAAAASIFGIVVGSGAGYWAFHPADNPEPSGLANAALYHSIYIKGDPNDKLGFDMPAGQNPPPDFRLPNLKPWGLDFRGARILAVDGQAATQLFYTTDNKALGTLTVVVANTSKPDVAPRWERRHDVNLLYWIHHGHAYALVGSADIGYLWNIHNDIAYQLDTI